MKGYVPLFSAFLFVLSLILDEDDVILSRDQSGD